MNHKLVLSFLDANDSTFALSYPYIRDELEQSHVTALINAIITNGSIFKRVPVKVKTAKLVNVTENNYEVA